MKPFVKIESIGVPFEEADIDTDTIFPARFLLLLDRVGFENYLFHDRRKTAGDSPFVIDALEYAGAQILIAGPRFGIGSSREHAVWALDAFGLRCIIAPSFGDIFYNNCIRNGVLPIAITEREHQEVLDAAKSLKTIEVDLQAQTIEVNSNLIKFEIDSNIKKTLLTGSDEIDKALALKKEIEAFEARQRKTRPWLQLSRAQIASIRPNIFIEQTQE